MRVLLLILLLAAAASGQTTWYCDPNGNTSTGDGSWENPWGTLESTFDAGLVQRRTHKDQGITNPSAPVQLGDTIKLLSGFHGSIDESGWWNTEGRITIEAYDANAPPILSRWSIQGASYWTISGLHIYQDYGNPGHPIVRFIGNPLRGGDSHDITIEGCTIRSDSLAEAATWTAQEWVDKAFNAIQLRAHNSLITGNTVLVSSQGILAGGDDTVVSYNLIDQYRRNGLRFDGPGDRMTWEYNIVLNSKGVDGNHDDGFILYFPGNTVEDMTFRGNIWLAWTDPNQPYASSTQGIFLGQVNNSGFRIENNLVFTPHHSHGIYFPDPNNAVIVNNTVIGLDGDYNFGNINITGTAVNTVIRNNIARAVTSGAGLTLDSNLTYGSAVVGVSSLDFDALFEDYDNLDFRLALGSSAIDAGSTTDAPVIDLMRYDRTETPDIGAFEYGSPEYLSLLGEPFEAPPYDPNDPEDPNVPTEPVTSRWLFLLR